MDESRSGGRPDHQLLQPTLLYVFRTDEASISQVHVIREAPRDLVRRMASHRLTIEREHPTDRLDQYVVVLGDGTVNKPGDPVRTGIYFDLRLLFLRDVEPPWFSLSPSFERLSHCLTLPTESEILGAAGVTMNRYLAPPPGDSADISPQLVSLFFQGRFGDHPDVPMSAQYPDWASAVHAALSYFAITNFDDVRQRISQRQGTADVIADLLADRFGDHLDIPLIAYRLAAKPSLDTVIRTITSATELDEVRAFCQSGAR